MRNAFSSVVALFWAILFATVTYGLAVDFQAAQGTISVLGATVSFPGPITTQLAAFLLALCFAVASLLFLWGAVVGVFGRSVDGNEQADLLAMAHSGAAGAVGIVLVATIALPGQPAFGPLVLQIGSLAASFLACQLQRFVSAERLALPIPHDDVRAVARSMARGAASNSMLPRMSGKERPIGSTR